jgi:adenylate kinase
MRIVILGAPGSGKNTQTSLLADKYRLTVVTTSELVKQALAEESERGVQLRQQQAGQPVTDDVVLSLLQERLDRDDLNNGFILDGFPRNLLQALTLDELLEELGLPLDFVLLFEIETDALMERLVGRRTCRSCGTVFNVYTQPTAVEDVCDLCGGRLHQRADDTEETVSSRLHVFDHLTGPLLGHYGKQSKVLRVDGEGEVETVFIRTHQAIDGFLAQQSIENTTAVQSVGRPAMAKTVADKPKVVKKRVSGAKKQPAAKKASAKSPVTAKGDKKAAASSQTGSKRAGAKRAVAKKASTKKVVKKKTAVKRATTAKAKPVVKKSAGKKTVVKKAAGKKKVVKKAALKKPVAKKRAPQRAEARPGTKKKTTGKPTTTRQAVKRKSVKKQSAKKRV